MLLPCSKGVKCIINFFINQNLLSHKEFWSYFPLPKLFPDPPHLPKIKQTEKKSQNKASTKRPLSSFCLDHLVPCMVLIHTVRLTGENRLHFASQSIAITLWVRGGTLHPLPPPSSGTLSASNSCRSYACCFSLCELPCSSANMRKVGSIAF